MKNMFLVIYCEIWLLLHDADRLIDLAVWFAKKSMTPIVLTWIFWVLFQIIYSTAK
jgi:uncharacterized membrane protein YhdT